MKKLFISILVLLPIFFFMITNGFCDDTEIFKDVKIEHFKVSTDADGRWNYSVKITNTGKKLCNNVFYIKIYKNDELWEELIMSKLLQGSTGGAYQTSNSAVMEKFFKNHVKDSNFKCALLLEDTYVEETKLRSEFKTVRIESYKDKVVVDSFKTDDKTYTAVLKNNSKFILDVGFVALELCNGQMRYKNSSFAVLRPGKTETVTRERGSAAEGCTGVLLKLIDHNCEPGKDLLFSKTFQYQQ